MQAQGLAHISRPVTAGHCLLDPLILNKHMALGKFLNPLGTAAL